ncbi:PepSY domain-containing protein [Shouchella shacheensis]|uniref:PepSY domain-containing protein n=1 Tax=Shouchella shacheensis TaxID=1649580 RepID=UPI000740463F|nr:PepSY domain-containing protein [Shouchella shacheensis]
MKKVKTVIAAAVVAGGIGVSAYALQDDTALAEETKEIDSPAVTIEEAKDIALKKTEGGSIKEAEVDEDDGVETYEIEVHKDGKEYDLDILKESGEIVKSKEDDRDDDDSEQPSKGNISMEEAINIALNEVAGTVKEVELDKDDGVYVYEIEIDADAHEEAEVEIDAATGNVLEVDIDD